MSSGAADTMSGGHTAHNTTSRQRWRILDYVKCGKPNDPGGQRTGAFHGFNSNYYLLAGWADTLYRRKSNIHSSHPEAVLGFHRSLYSRKKTDRHLSAFPLSRNDHILGRLLLRTSRSLGCSFKTGYQKRNDCFGSLAAHSITSRSMTAFR